MDLGCVHEDLALNSTEKADLISYTEIPDTLVLLTNLGTNKGRLCCYSLPPFISPQNQILGLRVGEVRTGKTKPDFYFIFSLEMNV